MTQASATSETEAETARRGYIVYDGDCGFCQNSVKRLTRIGYPGWIEPISFQAGEDDVLPRWGLSADDTSRAMYVLIEELDQGGAPVSGTQKLWRGAAGVNYLLRQHPSNPLWRVLGFPYLIPGIKQIQDFGYALIARNRHKLGGCGGEACALPPSK